VFTGVHEAPICKAFGSGAFTRNRSGSKDLLTETLTLCSGQLIASSAELHSDEYFYCRCGVSPYSTSKLHGAEILVGHWHLVVSKAVDTMIH